MLEHGIHFAGSTLLWPCTRKTPTFEKALFDILGLGFGKCGDFRAQGLNNYKRAGGLHCTTRSMWDGWLGNNIGHHSSFYIFRMLSFISISGR